MRAVLALAASAAALAAGCGSDDRERLPAACVSSPERIAGALADAPRTVRVDGVAISHCFNRGASGADSQAMGQMLLAAAQSLAATAAPDPEGDAAVQLGYLVGAVRRGAARTGVHGELARRIRMEGLPGSAAFRRGQRAGLARG